MQLETLAPMVAYVAIAVMGWFLRALWEADKSLRADLSKLKEELPVTYLMRSDYHRDIAEIKEMLRSISAKLDGKADK